MRNVPPGIQIISRRTLALLSELADSPALREPVTVPCVDVAEPPVELCSPCSAAHVPKSRKEVRGTVFANHRRNVVSRKGASLAWLDAYRLRSPGRYDPTS